MHELSVCQALVARLDELARQRGARRVARVWLDIGPLAGIEVPLLEQAWPLAAAGGVAEGAELRVEVAPLRVRCSSCGRDSDVVPNRLSCAHCGSGRTRLLSGDELVLNRVELVSMEEAI